MTRQILRFTQRLNLRLFSSSIRRVNIQLKEFPVPVDQLRIDLQHKFRQNTFLKYDLSPQKPSTTSIHDTINERSYKADKFKDICELNDQQPPTVGSIIEYVKDDNLYVGFVIRQALSKFNMSYNKLIVISMDNELEEVDTADVRLHFHGVFDNEWVESLRILENRHDTNYYARFIIIDILRVLINQSIEFMELVEPKLEIAYIQNSSTRLNSLSLDTVLENMESADSYFQQCCMIMACHKLMLARPNYWMIPNALPNLRTNLTHGYSNNIVTTNKYFTLPTNCMQYLNELDSIPLDKLNFFLEDLLRQQSSDNSRPLTDLHLYFSLWDGKGYRPIIELMKLAIIYPHPLYLEKLSKLTVFEDVSPESIYEFLTKVGIYNSESDIYLSTGVMGEFVINEKISISKPEEVKSKVEGREPLNDYFSHLRTKPYDESDIIYSISLGNSFIGVSLQKLNSRNYTVGVHIPDVAAKLAPKSSLMKQLMDNNTTNLTTNIGQSSINIFSTDFTKDYEFPEQFIEKKPEFLTASQIFRGFNTKDKERSTCLTVGFNYNTMESNAFKNVDGKTTLSLNDLTKVKVKKLDNEEFKQCLNGRPSLAFGLFSSKTSRITNEDYHNIGFIYNILRTHFSVRNINGAVNMNANNDKAQFFKNEINELVSNLVSNYGKQKSIPLIKHHQGILDSDNSLDPEIDQVLVHHDNLLLPKFHASTFFQTLISRDANGNVSAPAFLIGNNYLSKRIISLDNHRDFPSANEFGKVNLLQPLESFECLINQYQLVSELNEEYARVKTMSLDSGFDKARKYGRMKGHGFNINGPSNELVMSKHLQGIKNAYLVNEYVEDHSNRAIILKQLEAQLIQDKILDLDCIITSMGHDFQDGRLCKAFIKQLGIETEIFSQRRDLTIGSVIRSREVLHLNVIRGICVLAEDVY